MLYVDKEFQRSQILSSIKRWCLYMGVILSIVAIVGAWTSAGGLTFAAAWAYMFPAIVASLLLLPVLIYDMLKATNQVAGPIHRLRREMRRLESGEKVDEIKLRQNDHWSELADDFNRLATQIQNERQQRKENDHAPTARQTIYSLSESVN